jgi:hypothetical protein
MKGNNFTWRKPSNGGRGPVATRFSTVPSDGALYYPMREHPFLFLEFADLKFELPDRILDFIRKYGFLCECPPVSTTDMTLQRDMITSSNQSKSLDVWKEEIDALVDPLEEWRDIQRRYRQPKVGHLLELSSSDRDSLQQVIATVNKRLSQTSMPSMVIDHDGAPRILLQPRSLLGVFWIQLADAIEKNLYFTSCPQCLTWFQASPLKQCCSTRCRMRKQRSRQPDKGTPRRRK